MDKITDFYKNKKILITGVTGFKGAWLASWLLKMGAKVYGVGYNPNKNKNLFYRLNLQKRVKLNIYDIRNIKKLEKEVKRIKPSIIFHLAAQPIIFESYERPYETFDINFKGTLNILEISRKYKFIKSIILVTSDKCYENKGWVKGYKETDELGGVDPYSASKATAELAAKAYRESFFLNFNRGISTGRAGNVIGGGDWSPKRLIPDCIRALKSGKKIFLRNPKFNRPWQHVLEPLKGYIILAKKQYENPKKFSGAWNFGTESNSITNVEEVVRFMIKYWGSGTVRINKKKNFYEQHNLQLNISKAKKLLKWKPTYNIEDSVRITTEWYYQVLIQKRDSIDVTNEQIINYMYENKWY